MRPIFATLLFVLLSLLTQAQTPVAVGQGSYASFIPATENVATDSNPIYRIGNTDEPVPTNDWWTPLILQDMYGETEYHLWAHPIDFTVNRSGLGLHFATEWSGGQDINKQMVIPAPVRIGGEGFNPTSEAVKSWGDWTVHFRLQESNSEYVDVTIGHGLPFAWLEYSGVGTAQVTTDASSTAYNDTGSAQAFPFTGDHFGFTWQGRDYGVFAPAGTQFSRNGAAISAQFSGQARYLVVAALPNREALALFYRHAYALPRNSTVRWDYDEDAARVSTTWSLDTEVLQGADNGVLQGFLPHHVKYTETNFSLTDVSYLSARGRIRCATGNDFRIAYDYDGALTHLPAPETIPGKNNPYNAGQMEAYLSEFARYDVLRGEANTYTSGKSLTKFARFLTHADVLNDPNKEVIQNKLRDALQDWFTYTPGEPYSYYAYMPTFKALLGFETGFGSEGFNDHHFHYGYHVYAAGVLGMQDPSFIDEYGEMATLVAKEYANWDRRDQRFPLFRNFDPWEGHSWANGGYGMNPPIGNNQESTSEAMMSWTGLIHLGQATGNAEMLAAGVFGYVTEAAATNEYWFDRDDENLPPGYGPDGKIACILGGANVEYQTFFGLNPIYVHGIQYIPVMPSSYYLMQHGKFEAAQTEFDYLRTRSVAQGYGDIGEWGTEWNNIALRYASLFDPEWSVRNLSAVGDDAGEAGLSYYQVYANRSLGRRDFSYRIGAANSGVFYHQETQQYTYCAFNPTGNVKEYPVYRDGSVVGSITVPANQFYSTHTLDGGTNPGPDPNPGLPSPWTSADIGSVGVDGTAGFDDGTFTVEASGVDIWEQADGFRYVYQPLSGDGEIIAQVASLANTHPWAKAGVMMRESLQPGSRHAMATLTTQNGVEFLRRAITGGSAASTRQGGVSAPVWLRLTRVGDVFTAYSSDNGNTWTEIAQQEIGLAETIYVGLATTAHNNDVLTTARYRNVTVQPLDNGGGGNPTTCEGAVNDDFAYSVTNTSAGASLTFNPARNGVGDPTLILYYSTDASAIFPGYTTTPGEPFAIDAPAGTTVHFYYTYSVPEGGERTTLDDKQRFVVGSCIDNAGRRAASEKQVTQRSGSDRLSVFPNPVSRTLTVLGTAQPVEQVMVYDVAGRQQRVPFELGGTGSVRLDTRTLPPGVYRLRLQTATDVLNPSFIKQ